MGYEYLITAHVIGIVIVAGAIARWRHNIIWSLNQAVDDREAARAISRHLLGNQGINDALAVAMIQKIVDMAGETAMCKKEARPLYEQMCRAENALTDNLIHKITWSSCPKCRRLVACEGSPCAVGFCKGCGATIIESEIEPADPIQREANLIDTAFSLYQAARELLTALTRAPDIKQGQAEIKTAIASARKTMIAAERHWTKEIPVRWGRTLSGQFVTPPPYKIPHPDEKEAYDLHERLGMNITTVGEAIESDKQAQAHVNIGKGIQSAIEDAIYKATIEGLLPGDSITVGVDISTATTAIATVLHHADGTSEIFGNDSFGNHGMTRGKPRYGKAIEAIRNQENFEAEYQNTPSQPTGKPASPTHPEPVFNGDPMTSLPTQKSRLLSKAWRDLVDAGSRAAHNHALLEYQERHRQVHGVSDDTAVAWK